eukprot:g6547.t1
MELQAKLETFEKEISKLKAGNKKLKAENKKLKARNEKALQKKTRAAKTQKSAMALKASTKVKTGSDACTCDDDDDYCDLHCVVRPSRASLFVGEVVVVVMAAVRVCEAGAFTARTTALRPPPQSTVAVMALCR